MTSPTPRTIVCDVGAVAEPDLGTIDTLARLQLTARREGCEIRLHDASNELRDLLVLVGLDDVLRFE
jgi:ABC-type transporter Mla MlaB component